MKIVIIGAGKIGATLAEQLAAESHEITVVDSDREALDAVGNSLDVMTVEGNGGSKETLQEAGVDTADLAIAAALISSLTDRVVPDDLIIVGELGLAGEVRSVSNLDLRVREAARLGFTRAVVPLRNTEKRSLNVEGMHLVPVRSIHEVIRELKGQA